MKLRDYLKANNLTQKEFAKIIGVYPKYINTICKDDNLRVPDDVVEKLKPYGIKYNNPRMRMGEKVKKFPIVTPFDHFRSIVQLEFNKGQKKNKNTFYCMNKEELIYLIDYMEKQNIMFYTYEKDGYYIVNWEREDYL